MISDCVSCPDRDQVFCMVCLIEETHAHCWQPRESTINGATAVAELIGIPVQPSAPSETRADSVASNRISNDPVAERSSI